MTTPTWNDLPGHATRWWGLPVLAAMRRDDLAVISAQRPLGELVRGADDRGRSGRAGMAVTLRPEGGLRLRSHRRPA